MGDLFVFCAHVLFLTELYFGLALTVRPTQTTISFAALEALMAMTKRGEHMTPEKRL